MENHADSSYGPLPPDLVRASSPIDADAIIEKAGLFPVTRNQYRAVPPRLPFPPLPDRSLVPSYPDNRNASVHAVELA